MLPSEISADLLAARSLWLGTNQGPQVLTLMTINAAMRSWLCLSHPPGSVLVPGAHRAGHSEVALPHAPPTHRGMAGQGDL